MEKLIKWMNEKVSPALNKITKNPWILAIQDTMMQVMPMVFVGSIITVISLLKEIFPSFPDFSMINSFSFGLIGIFVAFLIPYNVMTKKGKDNVKIVSGLASIALFFMLINPTIESIDGTLSINFIFDRLGSVGMIVAIVGGLFVASVMNIFSKISFFKEDSVMPDFVIEWFDSLIPVTIILTVGWLFNFIIKIDLFNVIVNIFSPLTNVGQSLIGFVLLSFISVFFYSFGISSWIILPILIPIQLQGIADNAALVAQGLAPTFINTQEVFFSGFVAIGGIGSTLFLTIMMLLSKSNRLKAIGKATIVPSIFNINEPVVYGAPIAWNPILMIPFWLNGLIIPIITYIGLKIGLAPIPSKVFALWYVPYPISTYLVSGLKGLILFAITASVSILIWYPFFKVYENQEIKKEAEEADELDDLELEIN